MTITGILLPTSEYLPYSDNIVSGPVQYFSAQGVRTNISTAVNGDDIWSGTATTMPIPASAGEQMSIVSTSAQDKGTTPVGTGIQSVEIHYLNASGIEASEIIILNGTTPVNTTATNIRFVNDFYAKTFGPAAGNIIIYKTGSASTIYSIINIGHFRHSNTSKMVPEGYICIIESLMISGGAAAGGKSAQVSLRTTSHHGLLLPVSPNTVFNKQATVFVYNSAQSFNFQTPILVPALAVIKCTSWATAGGADIAANWYGKLVSAPV